MSLAQSNPITSQRPRRSSHLALVGAWVEVEPGIWVGSASGIYLGRIEAIGVSFRAIDELNVPVNDFAKLKDAVACLEGLAAVYRAIDG